MPSAQLFHDRQHAGRLLAVPLSQWENDAPIVLALPRGGVPVAYEIAQALHAPLEIILVRKIGAPNFPELGLGAVVEAVESRSPPHTVLNEKLITPTPKLNAYIETERQHQLDEIARRQKIYREGRSIMPIRDRTVIVVDDGIATGSTMKAALQALGHAGARQRILATPIAPSSVLQELAQEAEEIVCLASPEEFYSVGEFYENFDQLTDQEVIDLLEPE